MYFTSFSQRDKQRQYLGYKQNTQSTVIYNKKQKQSEGKGMIFLHALIISVLLQYRTKVKQM